MKARLGMLHCKMQKLNNKKTEAVVIQPRYTSHLETYGAIQLKQILHLTHAFLLSSVH